MASLKLYASTADMLRGNLKKAFPKAQAHCTDRCGPAGEKRAPAIWQISSDDMMKSLAFVLWVNIQPILDSLHHINQHVRTYPATLCRSIACSNAGSVLRLPSLITPWGFSGGDHRDKGIQSHSRLSTSPVKPLRKAALTQ